MIGLQEMKARMEKDEHKDAAKSVMDMLDSGYYDHQECNILGKGYLQRTYGIKEIARDDAHEITESLRTIPLREFLAKSSTTGLAGAAYLIPTKIYTTIFDAGSEVDRVADISMAMIPADQIGGTTMNVDILKDGQYKVNTTASGAQMPTETVQTVQATLDFTNVYSISPRITNDLIEDSAFDVMELHLRQAGAVIGEKAMDLACTVLKTGTDGDGTVNGGLSGDANETKFTGATTEDYKDIYQYILDDHFLPDTIIAVPHSMYHSVITTAFISASTYSEPWAYEAITQGLPKKILGCNMMYYTLDTLTNDQVMDNLVTIMFQKSKAMISGRKRWMRIEHYSDPVRDLVGAAITFRQDSVTVYNDAIGVITET